MDKLTEIKLREIVDRIVEEAYYNQHMSDTQRQYIENMKSSRINLREKLLDAIEEVLQRECGNSIPRRSLVFMIDPIVNGMIKYMKK